MDRHEARAGRLHQQARTATLTQTRPSGSSRHLRRALAAGALVLAVLALTAPAASASEAICNVAIPMSDGVILRGDLYLPSGSGHYPTVLTVTGYNKDAGNPTGQECGGSGSSGIAGDEPALAEKGYAVLVVDDRGTGASGGKWESWGERTQQDYKELLTWIQQQSWSDGSVAPTGESYMGITSLLIAEADAARVKEGLPRAVKAVWADIPMADAYRDVTFQGGSTDTGFIPFWLGLVTALSALPPSDTSSNPQEAASVYVEHLLANSEFDVSHLIGASLGEEGAYDGPFYRLRSPVVRASEITVPVVIQGGWWDLFQRGEPLLWESLKNSKDLVLFMSPHYHVTSGPAYEDPNIKEHWFGHWLKGEKNGVQKTPKVNLYPINGTHWEHFKKFPLPKTKYTRLYLNGEPSGSNPASLHDGSLASTPPKAESGDTAPLLPASSPCSRETAQWTAGLASNEICDKTNNTYEASSLTYTTAPLSAPETIEGLLKTNLWATLSTSDATMVAVLSEVEPDGKSEQITAGFLQASLRATDPSLATYGPKHIVTRPWHPFTKESQQAVTPGQPTEYEVEIYPTGVIVPAGDRLRLTIGTANTFTGTPSVPTLGQELGGTITLLHGGAHDSYVQLPAAG